jgi:thiol-disulfide isomerase/thioredoxin
VNRNRPRRTRTRKILPPGLSLLVCIILASGCTTGTDAAVQGSNFAVVSPDGKNQIFYEQAQRKNLKDISGSNVLDENSTISLKDFAGKVVVLNLWGSWCAPCRAETYEFKKLEDSTKDQPGQLIGVDVRDNRPAAADFINNFQVGYPSIFDPSQRVGLSLPGIPLAAIPITLVIDKQARVAAVFIGQILESDVLPTVQHVVAEPQVT